MGQHSDRQGPAPRRRRPSRVALGAAVLALLAGSIVAVRLVSSPPPDSRRSSCAGPPLPIVVGAADSARPWLGGLLDSYNGAGRTVDGRCVQVRLTALPTALARQQLRSGPFHGAGSPPDVWIPESTAELELVRAQPESVAVLPASAPPVASSPIVLAGPADAVRVLAGKLPAGRNPALADLLRAAADPRGWGQPGLGRPEWGPIRFSLPDPGRSALGASLLVAAAGATAGVRADAVTSATFRDPRAQRGLAQLGRTLAKVAATPGELLPDTGRPAGTTAALRSLGLVAAAERDVWRYNGGSPAVPLQASYPLDGNFAADYPFVVPNADWVDPADRQAAGDLRAWLRSGPVQDRLAGLGLRRSDGTAGTGLADGRGLLPQARRPIAPSPDAVLAATSAWRLLSTRVSILALLDVSGSMADPVEGTGRSKLDLAKAAAVNSLSLFQPRDRIGLWEFSENLSPGQDYRELVPLGAAGGTVDGRTRVQASVQAYRGMRPHTATGLYDSVLAAYAKATDNYVPGFVSSVVVLSDGRNEDTVGISLDDLVGQLRARFSADRPVHVVTIAYGTDADPAVLARIAQATHGLSVVSPDPRDIGLVFQQAVSTLSG